jgi:hypothetical protein
MDTFEKHQLELLKRKKPVERFLLMARLIQDQYDAMRAGIRHQRPELSEEELEKWLRKRMSRIYSSQR